MSVDLTNPIYTNEDAARAHLEGIRWPNGVVCPHCGGLRPAVMGGKSGRPGLFHCPDCREQFTVTVGGVMERSHIPLQKWVLGFALMTASKKGVSAHQLHRMLGIGYKSAWFMAHRIREAMTVKNPAPLGGAGGIVEADEAYHGKRETPVPTRRGDRPYTKGGKSGGAQKRPIFALVPSPKPRKISARGRARVNATSESGYAQPQWPFACPDRFARLLLGKLPRSRLEGGGTTTTQKVEPTYLAGFDPRRQFAKAAPRLQPERTAAHSWIRFHPPACHATH